MTNMMLDIVDDAFTFKFIYVELIAVCVSGYQLTSFLVNILFQGSAAHNKLIQLFMQHFVLFFSDSSVWYNVLRFS